MNPTGERRIQDLCFTAELFKERFREALPPDARVLQAEYDNREGVFHVVVESDTYPPLIEGNVILRQGAVFPRLQVPGPRGAPSREWGLD